MITRISDKILTVLFLCYFTIIMFYYWGFIMGVATVIFSVYQYKNLIQGPKTLEDKLIFKQGEGRAAVFSQYSTWPFVPAYILITVTIFAALSTIEDRTLSFLVAFLGPLTMVFLKPLFYWHKVPKKDLEARDKLTKELGFVIQDEVHHSTISETLLKLDIKPRLNHVSIGSVDNFPVRFFELTYQWAQKAKQKVLVVEVALPQISFPMLVLSKNSSFGRSVLAKKLIYKPEQVYLEGDFSKYFDLYVHPSAQLDIRRLLTPDLMANLIDHMKEMSFLLVDNRLYVVIADLNQISFDDEMYREQAHKAKQIILEWKPTLERLTVNSV